MRSEKRTGRLVGALLFAQLVGLILPFVWLHPMTTPDFLGEAAGAAAQVRWAVVLLFANGALIVGIAVAAFGALRERAPAMALWLLAVSVAWLVLQSVDNALLLSMLSLSERYAEGGASNPDAYGLLGEALRSTRRWAHYAALLAVEGWFAAFYGALLRSALVPRALATFGLAMAAVHAAAVTLPAFLGYGSAMTLAPSLALSHLAVGGWLLARGFVDRRHRHLAEPRGVGFAGA